MKVPISVVVLSCCVLFTNTACRTQKSAEHGPAHAPAHWGYAGGVGPAHWAGLSAEYGACAAGTCQSPIDLGKARDADLADPEFDYGPSGFSVVNNGHTVQVNVDPGCFMLLDGERFSLVQFHFHSPSEHHVGGASHPMEMHLVHKADDGTLGVVGVFIARGEAHSALANVWRQLPREAGPAVRGTATINPGDLLPQDRRSFRYGGSLTTPPCSEGVLWTVMTAPIQLSDAQIREFTSLYTGNNRPVQALNGREVVRDTSR